MALFRRRLRSPKGWNELTSVIIDMQEALEAWAARINPVILHKQDRLTAGDGISIENDVISVVRGDDSGGGDSESMCAYTPVIAVSPAAYTRVNDNVNMISRIKGTAYQWQYKAPDGAAWANTGLTGNKTDTLTVQATAGRNGYSYRCRVTVDGAYRYSDAITLAII